MDLHTERPLLPHSEYLEYRIKQKGCGFIVQYINTLRRIPFLWRWQWETLKFHVILDYADYDYWFKDREKAEEVIAELRKPNHGLW